MLCLVHDVLGACGDGGSGISLATASRRCPWESLMASPPWNSCECCAGIQFAWPVCTERIKLKTGNPMVTPTLISEGEQSRGRGMRLELLCSLASVVAINGMQTRGNASLGISKRRSSECTCVTIACLPLP